MCIKIAMIQKVPLPAQLINPCQYLDLTCQVIRFPGLYPPSLQPSNGPIISFPSHEIPEICHFNVQTLGGGAEPPPPYGNTSRDFTEIRQNYIGYTLHFAQ